MIQKIREFNKGFDEGDNLSRFFGVLKRFNLNHPMEPELKYKIE